MVAVVTAETKINTNFVFHRLTKDPVAYNSEMKVLYQDLYPCALHQAMDILDNISAAHDMICNTSLPEVSLINDKSKVKSYSDYYIMLPIPMSFEEGIRACEALGTDLVEIRTDEQRKDFINLMLSAQKSMTFAGLTVSDHESSIIFNSNGEPLDIYHPNNELFSEQYEPMLWNKFLDEKWITPTDDDVGNRNPRSHDYIFKYTVLTEDIQASSSIPMSLIITPVKDMDIFHDYPLTIVCNRPKELSDNRARLEKFKHDCTDNQVRLRMMSVNAKLSLNKVMPGQNDDLERYRVKQTQFEELLSLGPRQQEEEPLNKHCADLKDKKFEIFRPSMPQVMDFENDPRHRRSIIMSTMLKPLFSVINFALEDLAKPMIKYAVSAMISNWHTSSRNHQGHSRQPMKPTNHSSIALGTPAQQIITQVKHNNNVTDLILEEQRLSLDALHIVMFVQAATGNLARLLEANRKIPLTAIWTEKTYNSVRRQLQREQFDLNSDMTDAMFTIVRKSQAFRIQYYLPHLEQRKKAHMYRVYSLPITYGEKTYSTRPFSEYLAIDFSKDYFSPLTYQEVKNCIVTSCLISHAMISKHDTSFCGLDAYFASSMAPYANQACRYDVQRMTQSSKFITTGNITYFSVGDNIPLEMKCWRDEVTNSQYNISGLGSLSMPKKCDMSLRKGVIVHQVENNLGSDSSTTDRLSVKKVVSPPENLLQTFMEKDDNDKRHFELMKMEVRLLTIVVFILVFGTFIVVIVFCSQQTRRKKKSRKNEKSVLNKMSFEEQVAAISLDDNQQIRVETTNTYVSSGINHSIETSEAAETLERFIIPKNDTVMHEEK